MSTGLRTTGRLFLALAVVAVALAGCGRKGDPLKPSVAARQAAAEDGTASETAAEPEGVADRRIILDGLLD